MNAPHAIEAAPSLDSALIRLGSAGSENTSAGKPGPMKPVDPDEALAYVPGQH